MKKSTKKIKGYYDHNGKYCRATRRVRRVVLGEGYAFTEKCTIPDWFGGKPFKRMIGLVKDSGSVIKLDIADRFDGTNDKPYPRIRLVAEILEEGCK